MDLEFGTYRLKRAERRLLGPEGPVELSARSFDILAVLLERPDEMVSKAELFDAVWPGLVVEENTLQVHISALRKALDANMIVTVHGRGYKYAGPRPVRKPAGPAASEVPVPSSPMPDILPQAGGISIVVLPFVNMSSDAEHGFLADGLTEDLTTELSRHKNFLVIASASAFTYKGRAVDVAQVGRELGVHYVLEGSMRSLGARVRITAQLIDVSTGTHLWAEKFDRERAGLFDIQDEVVRAVAASTQTQLVIREGENRARDASEDCWALTMEAMAECYKMTAESLAKTEQIARRLTREYPRWARGYTFLSSAIYHQIIMGFEPASSERKDEALSMGRLGAALDPRDEYSLTQVALPLMDFVGDTGETLVLLRRAVEINPNFSLAYGLIGDAYLALGQPGEAIRHAEAAIRLNPRDPSIFYRYEALAKASLQNGDDDMALHWANQITALKPDYWPGYAIAAAVLAGKGDIDKARRSVEALKACWHGVSVSAIRDIEAHSNAAWRQRYLDNLIAAGVPE